MDEAMEVMEKNKCFNCQCSILFQKLKPESHHVLKKGDTALCYCADEHSLLLNSK